MKKTYKIALITLLAVIVISFFLPWIGVESKAVGKITKILTGKEQARLDTISAFKVPILANSNESRFMISVIKIFNPGIKHADKKSFLIYAIPLLAAIMATASWFLYKNKWINLACAIIGCSVFFVAAYKIATTDLNKLVLNVNIGLGLWLTLLGYLGIGILGIVHFIKLLKTN